MRKVLIIVPYQARDLDGHALVAFHLMSRYGYDVLLSNGYEIERKIMECQPDGVVFDHLAWDFKVRQAQLTKQLGAKVIVLPTEGLFQDKEGAVRRAGKLHNATHLVDCYLAWGRYPRDAILEEHLMDAARIHAPGCPRFDLYREPFTALWPTRTELTREFGFEDPSSPLILWATNTPHASRSRSKMLERQTMRAKKPVEEVRAHIEDHVEQLEKHSEIVLGLARRHPEWNILIKVHPAEWINPYIELAQGTSNVRVAFNAPVHSFLLHCDVLLQRNCTTATEAWILEKPVVNLEVGRYRRPVRAEYRAGNHPVYSIDEADAVTQSYLRGAGIPTEQHRARQAFIEDFYGSVDGSAGERCAHLIHRVLEPPQYTDEDHVAVQRSAQATLARWRETEDKRWPNRLKDVLGVDRRVSFRPWRRLRIREAKDNLGLFTAEADIRADVAERAIERYHHILAERPRAEART